MASTWSVPIRPHGTAGLQLTFIAAQTTEGPDLLSLFHALELCLEDLILSVGVPLMTMVAATRPSFGAPKDVVRANSPSSPEVRLS